MLSGLFGEGGDGMSILANIALEMIILAVLAFIGLVAFLVVTVVDWLINWRW